MYRVKMVYNGNARYSMNHKTIFFIKVIGGVIMEHLTAEQAAEAAKGLTYEKVWAIMMESRREWEESRMESRREWEESRREIEDARRREIDEAQHRTDKQMAELRTELNKSIGGLGNSLGRLTEAMFSAELCYKFNEHGYPFTKQANHVKYHRDGKIIAEADAVLEDGDYVMIVEVKTELSVDDVNDHLERIEIIRQYMDEREENRILVGAVAGAIIQDNVKKYAHRNGFYVVEQSGEAVSISEIPHGFKAREWA